MKQATFDNPNKMHFESPHLTFNRQTVLITKGNAILPTQFSYYIRPMQEVECNGQTHPQGHLQDFDLAHFRDLDVSLYEGRIKRIINDRGEKCILYCFRHSGGYHQIVDALVLTSGHDDGYHLLEVWYINRDWRAMQAVNEAILYVTNPLEARINN